MTQRILTDFSQRHTGLFGRHSVSLGHSLAGSSLFTDRALAGLIEALPAGACHVGTMDVATRDPRTRREGVVDGLSGAQALEAVRRGHIWIELRRPGLADLAYDELLEDMYEELEQLVPGFKSRRHTLSILISSPRVREAYRADLAGQLMWQVRGHRRIHVYPGTAPFVAQDVLEDLALGTAGSGSLDYEPWLDEYAQAVDLAPGRMLHWPRGAPHRIVNADNLNVTLLTEHWTDELSQAWAVDCANGLLRSSLGLGQLARPLSGPGMWARLALARAWQASTLFRRDLRKARIDFAVDLDAPWCVRAIEPYELTR